MRMPPLCAVLLPFLLAACAETGEEYPGSRPDAPPPAPPGAGASSAEAPSAPDALGAGPRIVFLGTSLTEGYGLARPEVEAWPARIGEMAREAGHPVVVVNAGLSGETSAGSLRRLDWVLREPADLLVVETGANDGLRALSLEDLERNLDAILRRAGDSSSSTRVALVAMEAPPNLGPDYADAFREVFPRVAERWGAALIPFPLDGVAGIPALNQSDGIHPTAAGHRIMAAHAWPVLDSLLATLPSN